MRTWLLLWYYSIVLLYDITWNYFMNVKLYKAVRECVNLAGETFIFKEMLSTVKCLSNYESQNMW